MTRMPMILIFFSFLVGTLTGFENFSIYYLGFWGVDNDITSFF